VTGTTNLETVQRGYEQTGGEYETRELEGLNELLPEIFDPEVEFSSWLAREVETAFGSPEEAMSTAMEAERA
jgi:hypothetical protein